MKKFIGIALVLALVLGAFAACGEKKPESENTDNAVSNAAEAVGEAVGDAAEAVEEVVEDAAEAVGEAVGDAVEAVEEAVAEITDPAAGNAAAEKESGNLFEQMDTWHWRTFECQYVDGNGELSGWAAGGHYENDEMADFIAANPEWYKDTDAMSKWEEADAPFGDAINSAIAAETPWTSDPANNHGIMFYKTFEVKDVSESSLYELYMFYDNTVYCYINGEPYFILDGNCVTQDWNGGYDLIHCNQGDKTLREFLHEGENYIAVSIKDAWGGREFDAYISYELGSTKRDLDLIPQGADWQYTTFNCPYIDGEGTENGGAAGGHFEPDEMADYIAAHPDFMSDTATASSWPTGTAPMSSGAQGWEGSNHGLMLYKTFTVDSVDAIKDCDEFDLYGDYDNAVHVYLNGVEIYTDDGEAVTQDWQYGITAVLDKDLMLGTLKNGENFLIVTVKDAWGGREWNCGLKAHWN